MPSRPPRELFRELGGLSDYQRGLVRRWLNGSSLNSLPKGKQADQVRATLRGYSRQQVRDAYGVYRFNARQITREREERKPQVVFPKAADKFNRASIEIRPITPPNLREGTAEVRGNRLKIIVKGKWGPSERITADGRIVTRDITHVQTKLWRREWLASIDALESGEYESVEQWAMDLTDADEAPESVESVYLIGS